MEPSQQQRVTEGLLLAATVWCKAPLFSIPRCSIQKEPFRAVSDILPPAYSPGCLYGLNPRRNICHPPYVQVGCSAEYAVNDNNNRNRQPRLIASSPHNHSNSGVVLVTIVRLFNPTLVLKD